MSLSWNYYQYSLETKAWLLPEIVSLPPALAIYSAYFELDILYDRDNIVNITQEYDPIHTLAKRYTYSYQYIGT